MKFKIGFILATLIVTLGVIPVIFNFVFLIDSGYAKGEMSDWFTLYGNIFGGLIGGFFTYVALMLTFKKEDENKKNEMKPKIDIPHKSIEFILSNDANDIISRSQIAIELNNIGGTLAKNIECKLTLSNYEEVLESLEKNKQKLQIELKKESAMSVANIEDSDKDEGVYLIVKKDGPYKGSLGKCDIEYNEVFVGSCIPVVLNHEAKTMYILDNSVSNWINYIVRNRKYNGMEFNRNELFNFDLEVKYSSIEYGETIDYFKLEWNFIGITLENSNIKFQYVLKSTKVDKK